MVKKWLRNILGLTTGKRSYQSGKSTRLTGGWATSNGSADQELASSLATMRARSRALIRDSSYAKRASVIVVNNVIGTGIGMQAQVVSTRGLMNERINDDIEEAWEDWSSADNCHTGGRLSFKHLERALMAQVFSAGEAFVRKHNSKFGNSDVPFALELIESERIADDLASPSFVVGSQNDVRMGIEIDEFFRPVAYYIRKKHPNDYRYNSGQKDKIERVPADQIIHLSIIDRWPQTRGEPWMHAVIRRLNDMDGYSEAEIIRARGQAVRMGIIESAEDSTSFGEEQDDGSVQMELEPGIVQRLNPGEKWHDSAPSAPNPALDPFMRYMLREVAAGAGVSYESLSRDYSQSNYSSSRLALLDDRDLWRFFQSWFICDFRKQVHREWLRQAVLAGAIKSIPIEQYAVDSKKFEKVLFKPRGWTWIDPTTEVEAYKEAVKQGFTTVTDVIAATGGGQDIEDVLAIRSRELKMMEDQDLVFETSPEFYLNDGAGQPPANPDTEPASTASAEDATGPQPKRGSSFMGLVK